MQLVTTRNNLFEKMIGDKKREKVPLQQTLGVTSGQICPTGGAGVQAGVFFRQANVASVWVSANGHGPSRVLTGGVGGWGEVAAPLLTTCSATQRHKESGQHTSHRPQQATRSRHTHGSAGWRGGGVGGGAWRHAPELSPCRRRG